MMARAKRHRERGLTLIEMLIALALLGFILLGILPLFMGSVKSNFSANEYTSIHNLCRDRLEQLMNLTFNGPQLSVGVIHPNDLPPVLPDPATGVPPASGGILNPYRLTYTVRQYATPDSAGVPNGSAFTPVRVVAANQVFHYKRIDVTVTSSTGPLGIGARVAQVSGVVGNPFPASASAPCGSAGVICSVDDPLP